MKKNLGVILVVMFSLSACSVLPSRQTETQSTPQQTSPNAEVASPETSISPGQGGYLQGDGPRSDIPANIDATPDAVPRPELLHRYANRPYVVLGHSYTPRTAPGNYSKRGIASWYGKKFHGQPTSSGEIYDMFAMTAAHPILPIPSYARVTNLSNHKSVVVRINDRGPFLHDRIIDLSYTAAHKLGIINKGSSEVEVTSIVANGSSATPIAVNDIVTHQPLPEKPAFSLTPVASGSTYLQLGAFKSQRGAENFLAKMRSEFNGNGKQIELYKKNDLLRVHIGPYVSVEEALTTAEMLKTRLGFKPLLESLQ